MARALLGAIKEVPYLGADSRTDENQCGSERGGFVVTGPGRTDRPAKACDTALHLASPFRERHLRPGIKLSHWDGRDGDLQIFASRVDGTAEEFAFRGVDQGVRRENLGQRRQCTTRSQ
jgi:hypothetical protein